VVVPDVRNLPLATAQTTLSQNKLRGVQDSTTFSDTVPQGSVVSQSVQDGTKVRPNSTVLLTVSSGTQKGPIPDVSNKSLADAQAALKSAGFTPGTVTNEFSKTVPQGQVTHTDPPANTQAAKATPVTIFVSAGQATSPLTDVTGLDPAQAQKVLKDEGFNPVVTNTCNRGAKPATVLSQSPQGGQPAPQNSDVAITVNQAQPVPNVVGMSQSQATSTIQQAGFTPQVQTQSQLLPTGAGNVSSQSPAAGQIACPGDSVTITVPQALGGSPTASPSSSPSP